MTNIKLDNYGNVTEIEEMTVHIGGWKGEFMWIEFTAKDGTKHKTMRYKGGL